MLMYFVQSIAIYFTYASKIINTKVNLVKCMLLIANTQIDAALSQQE